MGSVTPGVPRSERTPAQAADTILGLYAIESKRAPGENGARVPSALGKVAIHTLRLTGDPKIDERLHLPLTVQEMGAGLKYIEEESRQPVVASKVVKELPVEPTEGEWARINNLADSAGFPLDQAYATIMGIWPN